MKEKFDFVKFNHVWSVLCSDTSIDVDSNNISMKVLEQLNIEKELETKLGDGQQNLEKDKGFPFPIRLYLVSLWSRAKKSVDDIPFKTRIEQVDPKGRVLGAFESEARIPRGTRRLRTRTFINGLNTTVPGEYFFRLIVKVEGQEDAITAQIPLELRINVKQKEGFAMV